MVSGDAVGPVPEMPMADELRRCSPPKVLTGLQVIDLTTGVAGPILGQLLADFGAEVVKIEPPEGDPARGCAGFRVRNQGKYSVCVDPAEPLESAWLAELLLGADACLLPKRGALLNYGLDLDSLMQGNPRLVVCETPPFKSATWWTGGFESNGLLAAALGVAAKQYSSDGGPVESVYPHLLNVQGVWGAACTVAALVERQRSGFGQLVTVSGANAVMEVQAAGLTVNPDLPDSASSTGAGGKHPTYSRFETADGLWLASGALGTKFELAILNILNLESVLADVRLGGDIGNMVTEENWRWVRERVAAAFLTGSRADWLSRMEARGIPCGPLERSDVWLDSEHAVDIGMVERWEDSDGRTVVSSGVPILLCSTPGRRDRPTPALGEHAKLVQIRAAPALSAGAPPLTPGPLFGYRVVDIGTFVAAPYAGMLMTELGATVTKVEPPSGDPFRVTGSPFNRGMRSLAVDLKAPSGQSFLHGIVQTSHAVIEGMRPGVAAELAMDYASLRVHAPDIVAISLSAYGEGGALSGRPGVDMVLQAMSGMMSAEGGDAEPVVNTIPIIDVATSAMIVLAVTLGLYHRNETGSGQRGWVSLASTATFLQDEALARYSDRAPALRGALDYRGSAAFDRYYRVRDGWVRIAVPDGCSPAMRDLISAGLPISKILWDIDPADALTASLAQIPAREAVVRLSKANVGAHAARRISEVIRDHRLIAEEFIHIREATDGSTFVTPGRYASFSRTQRAGALCSPGVGEHTLDILAESALAESETNALVKSGVVVIGTRMQQQAPPAYR